uniref:Acyl-CoA synthetase family member 3 n=1 Tax=Sinocyclocheilus anshuiensis TaxID=1608454 RepID=A0A671QZI3_9TELE
CLKCQATVELMLLVCAGSRRALKWLLGNVEQRTFTSSNLKISPAIGRVVPVFSRASAYGGNVAITDHSESHTYHSLYKNSKSLAGLITKALTCQSGNLQGKRISFLCWASWMCGGIAVPLYRKHPPSDLLLVARQPFMDNLEPLAQKLGLPCLQLPTTSSLDTLQSEDTQMLPEENISDWAERPAMLIYTSGTMGRPKGVLHTHSSLQAMVQGLVSEWAWNRDDVILHTLPLHHVHGIVNKLMCPLWVGATCIMLPEFSAQKVWEQLIGSKSPMVNVFMAVPTIYSKLIEYYDQHFTQPRVQDFIRAVCKERIRLMVSGSAALPQPVLKRWAEITGHVLLERYGMAEISMALSNLLKGPRVPGRSVGLMGPQQDVHHPLERGGCPVEAKRKGPELPVKAGLEGKEGELLVRGSSVFQKCWNKPQETADTFTEDGWFKTGTALTLTLYGMYWIMGRTSVDIIKSGGYKISALDVAVIGAPDPTWGQKVTAVVQLKKGKTLTLSQLKHMALYTIPTGLILVEEMARNQMGKVNKKDLLRQFSPTRSD